MAFTILDNNDMKNIQILFIYSFIVLVYCFNLFIYCFYLFIYNFYLLFWFIVFIDFIHCFYLLLIFCFVMFIIFSYSNIISLRCGVIFVKKWYSWNTCVRSHLQFLFLRIFWIVFFNGFHFNGFSFYKLFATVTVKMKKVNKLIDCLNATR